MFCFEGQAKGVFGYFMLGRERNMLITVTTHKDGDHSGFCTSPRYREETTIYDFGHYSPDSQTVKSWQNLFIIHKGQEVEDVSDGSAERGIPHRMTTYQDEIQIHQESRI